MSIPEAGRGGRRARWGWALFDWASQPYYTLITTFIFAPYFTTRLVGDAAQGQALLAAGLAVAGLIVALSAPVLGAIGDVRGPRKPWIAGACLIAAAAMTALWWAAPGGLNKILVLALIALASIAVEVAVVFNNAMLPSLVPANRLGRLSGFGWGLGYVGGLLSLLLVVGVLGQPVSGLDPALFEPARASGPLSAIWLLVFILPLMLWTPDAPRTGGRYSQSVRRGLKSLGATLGAVRRQPHIVRFLIARMLYIDGLGAIFAFGGVYAAGVFGWRTTTLGIFGIILILFAMAGAFAGGRLDDRLGSKKTILIGLAGLFIGTLGIISIDSAHALFVIPLTVTGTGGLFAESGEKLMIAFAALVGLSGGPVQAASRSLMARLAPPAERSKYFGLYALSGKATAFLAPLLIAPLTAASGSQRVGLSVILLFLAAGAALLVGLRQP